MDINPQLKRQDIIGHYFAWLARRRFLSILMSGLLSFGGSWVIALKNGFPIPYIDDEYGHLLAADTFAHGRITNPQHPLWEHFETLFELMKPTYMSMYPPAQGMFLAIGKVLFGYPIFGVWLSDGLMCAAICWMLYAWVTPRWALAGGLISVIQFGIFTEWSQSYLGGATAALGGALILGAIPRIFEYQRIRDALWFSLGLAIVLNSRPLEGLVIGVPLSLILFWKELSREKILNPQFFKKIVFSIGVCMLITAILMGYYNKRVTGDAFLMPHEAYRKWYESVPLFSWQPLRPDIKSENSQSEQFENDWHNQYFRMKKTLYGFELAMGYGSARIFKFYFGYLMAFVAFGMIALVNLNWRSIGALILQTSIFLIMFAITFCRVKPIYYASFACLAVLLVINGLRVLTKIRLGRIPAGLLLIIVSVFYQIPINYSSNLNVYFHDWSRARVLGPSTIKLPSTFTQPEMINALLKQGGRYLVIVQYPPWHNYHREWIHNDADIDHSSIVWARDLGEQRNAKLLSYFRDRILCRIKIIWDPPSPFYF